MVLLGLVLFCTALARGGAGDAPAPKVHELQAAFIYNFTKFIEWPTNSFRDTPAPFVIAVAGNSPCLTALEELARGRKVAGRALVIVPVKSVEAARSAQVVFVPATEEKKWLPGGCGPNVLTIGESEWFSKNGGMINLLMEGEKIRFEIDMDKAESAGLKVSAQLQKLAKTVRRKS